MKEKSTFSNVDHGESFSSKISWYSITVIFRLVSTLILTQSGYIHPDEFFQGPQIVFDDFFQANLTRTYEFQPPAPLRSVAILYILYGFPVLVLSRLSTLFEWPSIPFHYRLIFPRASILGLSFAADLVFFRTISLFQPKIHPNLRTNIINYYAFSYVTLIFFTRTLSNSVEAFLFVSLIYAILSNVQSIESELNRTVTKKSSSKILTIEFNLRLTSILIGFLCALGVFNRPTFPVFAAVPIFYWFHRVIVNCPYSIHNYQFLSRILTTIIGTFLLTCTGFIIFDTYYYNGEFILDADVLHRLVICPWNFFTYNTDSSNLNEHGLHPFWLHFIVNGCLLYGPLHLFAVYLGFLYLFDLFKRIFVRYRSESSISIFNLALYLFPFLPLSLIPHQEARFLLPIVYPLILVTIPKLNEYHRFQRFCFPTYIIFNLVLGLLYGYLHQGGLLPALDQIHRTVCRTSDEFKSESFNRNILVTYHTYMPVDYLVKPMSNFKSKNRIDLSIVDLQGAPKSEFNQTIQRLLFDEHSIDRIRVFALLPATCRIDFNEPTFDLHLVNRFGSHLDFDHSIELPKFKATLHWLESIWNQYKLNLYEIKRT